MSECHMEDGELQAGEGGEGDGGKGGQEEMGTDR